LCRRVDELIDCLIGQNVLVIGARDYVKIPKGYGPLRPGFLRKYPCFIHASFMILKPKQIRKIFGNYSLYHRNALHEPYHGISIRSAGKIVFLDSEMHDSIPLLTRYSWKGKTYAWHAWYSSRTVGLSLNELLDELPVSWLRKVRKLIYDFMENLHNETLTNRRRRIP
ncbi:MAG: hypothetical protein N3H31_07585, partial [Candidatus Nezhaarchaeota archaeon]|nr:hypothetical protein [Candidatus Nezhaarchaeota archaeon]